MGRVTGPLILDECHARFSLCFQEFHTNTMTKKKLGGGMIIVKGSIMIQQRTPGASSKKKNVLVVCNEKGVVCDPVLYMHGSLF